MRWWIALEGLCQPDPMGGDSSDHDQGVPGVGEHSGAGPDVPNAEATILAEEEDEKWVATFRRFFEGWLAPDALAEMEAVARQLEKPIAAPTTFQRRFEAIVREAGEAVEQEQDSSAARHALQVGLDRMRLHQERTDGQVLESPAGSGFLSFLVGARDSIGVEGFRALCRPVQAFTFDALIEPGNRAEVEVTGEEKVSFILRQHRRWAERLYKPLLQAALRIWRRSRGKPEGEMSNELGKLMGDCEAAWEGPDGPTIVLDQFARLARNSDGHSATEFDPPTRMVTLVNTSRSGEETRVSLPAAEMRERVVEFIHLCLTMWSAFRVASGLPFADLPVAACADAPTDEPTAE